MTLPVYIYGQQVLRKVAQDIPLDYPNLKELIQNMFETMEASDGIGLAAPQIGLDIRLLVVDLDVLAETYPEYKGYRKAFINPHIVEIDKQSPTESLEEAADKGLIDKRVYALGGIDIDNVRMAKELGFGGVVVCSDLWKRFDIHNGTDFRDLLTLFRNYQKVVG